MKHPYHTKKYKIQEMKLTYLWARNIHTLKTWSLSGVHPNGRLSHVFKKLALWGPLTKNTYVYLCEHFPIIQMTHKFIVK
jgi:hypothetical protein